MKVTGRKVRGLQTGNRLQVSDFFFFLISSLSIKRKQTLHGNISLKLLMKLCIYFGICLSLKWLYLKLTFLLFSNLGLIIAQQTRNHISCFTAGGLHISCRPISNMHTVGEGPGETPSALRCLSYLINSFLTDIKQLANTSGGGHSPFSF